MTRVKLALAIALATLFAPGGNFAQHLPFPDQEPALSPLRDANDLLLAQRYDYWINEVWEATDSVKFEYDADNLRTEGILRIKEGGEWVNETRIAYQYNSNQQATKDLTQEWDGSAWVNYRKISREFNGNGDRILQLTQNWNGANWVDDRRTLYEYDGNYNETRSLTQKWDGAEWDNLFQYLTSYNAENLADSVLNQNWIVGAWVNFNLTINQYDAYQQLVHYEWKSWDSDNGVWINNRQFTQEFDANGNQTLRLVKRWISGNWANDSQSIYEYDGDGNRIHALLQDWDNSSWVNTDYITYEIDAFGNTILFLNQIWNGAEWENNYRVVYYFQIISAHPELPPFPGILSVYPNPSEGPLVMDFGKKQLQNGIIRLYHSSGKLVHTQPVPQGVTGLQLFASLPEGVYHLQLLEDGVPVGQARVVIAR